MMTETVEVRAAAWHTAPKTQKDIDRMYEEGADFRDAFTGRYLNRVEAKKFGLRVLVRYANDSKVHIPKANLKDVP